MLAYFSLLLLHNNVAFWFGAIIWRKSCILFWAFSFDMTARYAWNPDSSISLFLLHFFYIVSSDVYWYTIICCKICPPPLFFQKWFLGRLHLTEITCIKNCFFSLLGNLRNEFYKNIFAGIINIFKLLLLSNILSTLAILF